MIVPVGLLSFFFMSIISARMVRGPSSWQSYYQPLGSQDSKPTRLFRTAKIENESWIGESFWILLLHMSIDNLVGCSFALSGTAW